MKLVDLSHPISNTMSTYPSDPKTSIIKEKEIETNNSLLHSITIGTHTGTHLDTPSHIISGGKTLNDFPLSSFKGKAVKINKNYLQNYDLSKIDGIIYETGWYKFYNNSKKYFGNNRPRIPKGLINYLLDSNIKFFGCDLPSVDETGSKTKPIHNSLLNRDVIIYESLTNLNQVPLNQHFEFIGFPLSLYGLEGSPVRAVAII